MNEALVDKIAATVLYEGYALYPYRPSLKSRQRWTFGGLYPRAYSEAHQGTDAWTAQTQCLIEGNPQTTLTVRVRCLHLLDRQIGVPAEGAPFFDQQALDQQTSLDATTLAEHAELSALVPPYQPVESLEVGGTRYHAWQEAAEREIRLEGFRVGDLLTQPHCREFTFPSQREWAPLRTEGGDVAGIMIRQQQRVDGSVTVSAEQLESQLFRVTVRVCNLSPLETAEPVDAGRISRDEALLRALVATHTVLQVQEGAFVSLLDPPPRWRATAAQCRNVGTYPVLVGDEGAKDTMLSAPIILYDYPQIAPESPGDLFDCTEIDEILSLRILTLTDEEKRVMSSVDPRTRVLLERTEELAHDELLGLHGTLRGVQPSAEEE
jgi:hypothetical protein